MKTFAIAFLAGVFLITGSNFALAKKTPPADIVDYDFVGFTCPQSVSADTQEMEVRVQIVNYGTSNPGAYMLIQEFDALLGDYRGELVSEQIFDTLDKGKQRPTEYVYTVSPPKYKHYIEFQALITDGYNNVNDSDFISCVTQVTP